MCGIIAIAGKNIHRRQYNTEAMLSSLSRRGPDGEGIYSQQYCWLGHRRLSIVDLAHGKQPMVDDQLSITFNGEIYNYPELRKELERKNHHFSTNSDTEVILKAYKEYGVDCPKHLDGMFAFAIWNDATQELFIARDRFGKKPLFYCFDGDNILIASEIKALLASGKVDGKLDYKSLDNYLQLMYLPPWKSIYSNIFQIPPAHSALYKNGLISTTRYWNLEFKQLSISYDEAKEEVRKLLNNAVKKRMLTSDVEIGALLSGGVDSTYISLLAKDHLNHPLKTFALGYGQYINELPFAEQAAKAIGSEHYTLQAGGENIEDLEKVISYFDEPHADTSDFPQHLISELVASKVKVALSGDGGDELFMGYGWYTRHMHLSYKAHTAEKLFLNPFQGRIRGSRIFTAIERAALWGSVHPVNSDIYSTESYTGKLSPINKINIFDLTTYLPGQLLTKIDRTGMMHSLEVRSPFLDTALTEFVCNLPVEFKANNNEQKIILKDLLSEMMPKDFVYRRKQGFGAPTRKWLREPKMKEYVLTQLGSTARVRQLFTNKVINYLLHVFYEKNDDRPTMRIWILLCLEIWLKKNNPTL